MALAATAGHSDVVNILIDAGAEIAARDERGANPLINAAREGKLSAVVTLLDRGAKVNFAEYDGSTALHRAVIFGHHDVADVLIKAGAAVNTHHTEDYTPLLSISQYGHTECGRLLIEAGANVNAAGKDGSTPLYHVAFKGYIDFLELLLSAGAIESVNVPDKYGRAPLDAAAFSGNVEAVHILLEAGSDPNRLDMAGGNVLCRVKNIDILKALLDKGANARIVDKDGWNALHYAADVGSIAAILVALVKAGANPTLQNSDGDTPADVARIHGHVVTAQMLDRLAAKDAESRSSEETKADGKGAASAKMSRQPDINAQMKSCSMKGSEIVKQYKKADVAEPCLNCDTRTFRLCSNCGASHFCSRACELSARHLCCG